ncbi:MAG TPA: HAD family hydrolase [Ignavibacteria bacterium]|nr:HAD family hydrolase [Ignavibacteria bacterium]
MNKAIFLDRDGTINEDVHFLTKIEDIKIFDGVKEALLNFRQNGFLNIIISNQSGVARGYMTMNELQGITDEILNTLRNDENSLINGVFYSPYLAEGKIGKYKIDHDDRKPKTGMIVKAINKYDIDKTKSWMIGDSLTDMQCALTAGIKKILVKTGKGKTELIKCKEANIIPEYVAENLLDASEYILKSGN